MLTKRKKCPFCLGRNSFFARQCKKVGIVFAQMLPHKFRAQKTDAAYTYVIIFIPGVIAQSRTILVAKYLGELNYRFTIRNIVWVWAATLFPLVLAHLAAFLSAINAWLLVFVFFCMPVILLRCVMLLHRRLRDYQFSIVLAFTSFCANLWGFASAISYGNISIVDAMRLAVSQGITASAGVLNWCIILTLPLIHIFFAVYRTALYVKGERSPYNTSTHNMFR